MGARALSLWGTFKHYRILLQKYLLEIPPQAKDELSLSVSRLLGLYDPFYFDLGMLHREPSQLFREWEERFETSQAGELISAIRQGDIHRDLLESTHDTQRERFRRWFNDDTSAFMKQLPERLPQETAFLMAFLFLSPSGLHIDPEQ